MQAEETSSLQTPKKTDNLQLEVCNPLSILKFCESLTDNNNILLQKKINKYFKNATNSGVVFVVVILKETQEALIHVIGDRALTKELRFPVSNSVLNKTLKRRASFSTKSTEFLPEVRKMLHSVVPSSSECLSIPIMRSDNGHVALILCLVDYKHIDNEKEYYTKFVQETFRFCLTTILNTMALEEEMRLKVQCQQLLAVARKLFSHLGDLNDLLREIMTEARKLTKAERCSLFLLDPDHIYLVAKVFDGVITSDQSVSEVRIGKSQGIAGHVAATGKVLNIRDAYKHPLFYKGMDEATGFRTRNILCFPIRDEHGIVGVAQLCNKRDGLYFDVFDEEVALAFSIYCGISIMHSLVYKKIKDAQARSKLSNELMMYHMKVNQTDINKFLSCNHSHVHPHLEALNFSPRELPTSETPCFVMKMFENCNMINRWKIRRQTLARFILMVQRGYREPPYHNWDHAFSVFHFAYLCLKNFDMVDSGYFTEIEALAYLVSCLCHDIDHRGTNNSFQTKSGSVLASLYSSEGSVMERHHLSQTICILNTENCNFLESLGSNDYSTCLDLIRDMILATDLAHHFQIAKEQRNEFETGYDPDIKVHKNLLVCLLMTAADLSDQTKEWPTTKRVAELIYNEFFSQGDLEKALGTTPMEMMDREKASIPDSQIEFLDNVATPVYSTLQLVFPPAATLTKAVQANRKRWELSKPVFETYVRRVSDGGAEPSVAEKLERIKKQTAQAFAKI